MIERMNQKKRALVLFFLGSLLFSACLTRQTGATGARGPAPGSPEAVLALRVWMLTGITHDGEFIPLEPGHGTTANLFFRPDGKLEGTTGIGSFSGSWAIRGSAGKRAWSVRLDPGSRRTGGKQNETALRFERELLLALAAARTLKTEKDSFLLLDAQGRILLRYLDTGEPGY